MEVHNMRLPENATPLFSGTGQTLEWPSLASFKAWTGFARLEARFAGTDVLRPPVIPFSYRFK
jgi:hypothetical protein